MVEIRVDRNIFSDEVISKAVYWETDRYTIRRRLQQDEEILLFVPKGLDIESEETLQKRFFTRLNDIKVQQIVNNETKDIRTILYIKAFANSEDLEDLNE